MSDETYIGQTIFRFEPPDVCVAVTVGDLSAADMAAVLDEIQRRGEGKEYIFLLNDISRIGSVAPEARKLAGDRANTLNMRGVAVFGASFHQRVAATLLAKMLVIFGKATENPIKFFDTEAEARAWLNLRRRQLGRTSVT